MDQSFLVENQLDNNLNGNLNENINYDNETKLETPIPPLHVQQKYLNDTNKIVDVNESSQFLRSNCSRCKKDFDQPIIIPKVKDSNDDVAKPLVEPKIFKLCQHCRELQRQRSRRWQKKTKEKFGVCRRCGNDIPPDLQKFVLCLNCRQNLRFRKANRAKQGRCVHCSGPLDTSIITNNNENNGIPKPNKNFKVCQRCRENDKIRRNNLEKLGNCNRCAKPLSNEDIGKHKVCINCRTKKKKNSTSDENLSVVNTTNLSNSMNTLPINYNIETVSNSVSNVPTSNNNGQSGDFEGLHYQSYPVQQIPQVQQQVRGPQQSSPNNNNAPIPPMNMGMNYYNNQVPLNMNQLPLHQLPLQPPIMVNNLGQYNQLPQINNQLYMNQPLNNYIPLPINQINQQVQMPQNQIPNQNQNQGQKISPNQQNLQMNQMPYHYQ
ncbi:hypothetical protein CLIB1444_06S02740 [[Candida] jaroonii]|uniref:Uncharacterized protein n=1 Tax=[Candida] jaroonii TaxID=467808 RepID=A0ACA9Y8V6_9ASCO|nr:hypothetical protein CLIB1444_06S02740 [[Candida] jaroonii]